MGRRGAITFAQLPATMSVHFGAVRAPRGSFAARLLCFVVICPTASGDSVFEIAGKLKAFRSAAVSVFDDTAAGMRSAGATPEADKVAKWSDDWLSILGVNKGVTGLTKDFVLNYLGRSSYHDRNGKLLDYIKQASSAIQGNPSALDTHDITKMQKAVKSVCREWTQLFERVGR